MYTTPHGCFILADGRISNLMQFYNEMACYTDIEAELSTFTRYHNQGICCTPHIHVCPPTQSQNTAQWSQVLF